MIGLDTGFFVELLKNKDLPVEVWKQLIEGQSDGVCSVLTLFELDRLGLKGQIERKGIDLLLEGAELLYTTDSDFEKRDKGGVKVVNLAK